VWWTKSKISLLLLLGLILGAIHPISTLAQTADVPDVEFQLVWDGIVRTPGWTELQVTLQNEAGDWDGELLLVDTNDLVTYHQALSLPAHSRKTYRTPLFVSEGWGLEMQLQDADGRLVYQQPLILNPKASSPVCGIADSQGLLSDVSNVCDTTFLVQDLTLLPETPMVWDSVDVFLINGLDTAELTEQQQTALLAWVANGGCLILSGGAALPQTLAGLPDALRIATPGAVQTFTGLDTAIAPEGQVVAPALALSSDATSTLAAPDGTYLTAQQTIGRGSVTIIAWDAIQAQSLTWLANSWKETAKSEAEDVALQSLSSENYFNTQWLLSVPSTSTPKLWHWLLFFPLYILLIGPLTWFLVRRLKRPVLTWGLLPTWIVLALILVALGLNGVFGRSFPLIHEIAAIQVPGNGLPAHVLQGTAIYAPRTRRLNWRTTGAPRPLYGGYVLNSSYSEGDPYPVDVIYQDDDYAIAVSKPFGIITWGAEGVYVPPALQSELSIIPSQEAPILTGVLQGETNLRNVRLLLGNAQYALRLTDTLTAGVSLNIVESLTQTYTSYDYGQSSDPCGATSIYPTYVSYVGKPSSTNMALYMERIRNTPCRITAVVDGVPFPAQDIAGVHVTESCLIYTVPCPTQTSGPVFATLRGNELPVSGGWVDDAGRVQMSAPATDITYILPEFLNIRTVQAVTLTVEQPEWWSSSDPFDPATQIAKLALWDWKQKDWIAQPLPTLEKPLVVTDVEAQRFFDALSGVQVRLESQDGNNSVKITVAVAGTW